MTRSVTLDAAPSKVVTEMNPACAAALCPKGQPLARKRHAVELARPEGKGLDGRWGARAWTIRCKLEGGGSKGTFESPAALGGGRAVRAGTFPGGPGCAIGSATKRSPCPRRGTLAVRWRETRWQATAERLEHDQKAIVVHRRAGDREARERTRTGGRYCGETTAGARSREDVSKRGVRYKFIDGWPRLFLQGSGRVQAWVW